MEGNGDGEVIRREATVEGGMQGVRGGTRGRIHVESSNDSTWKSSGTMAAVDPPIGRGAQDIQDVIPGKGWTEAVSGNRVPGGSSDTDGDAGALPALERTRHRGDAGGGQTPPPTMSPVRLTGIQEGAQWAPPGDLTVSEGGGAETMAFNIDGDAEEHIEGVPRLWEADGGGIRIPLPRAAAHGDR